MNIHARVRMQMNHTQMIHFVLVISFNIMYKRPATKYGKMGKAIAFSFLSTKSWRASYSFCFLVKRVYLILRQWWKTNYICLFK